MQARVVAAALDDGVVRHLAHGLARRVLERRDVALHELVLQVQRRRRDDDPLAVQEARYELAKRLARARACLNEEVLAADERMAYGFCHLDLAGALFSPDRLDGGMQHRANVGSRGHSRRLSAVSHASLSASAVSLPGHQVSIRRPRTASYSTDELVE